MLNRCLMDEVKLCVNFSVKCLTSFVRYGCLKDVLYVMDVSTTSFVCYVMFCRYGCFEDVVLYNVRLEKTHSDCVKYLKRFSIFYNSLKMLRHIFSRKFSTITLPEACFK